MKSIRLIRMFMIKRSDSIINKLFVKSLISYILLLIISCDGADKKSDDDKKEITINLAPSGDYYIGVKDGEFTHESQPFWTTDFVNYTQLTNQFDGGISKLWLNNDTIVFLEFQSPTTAKYNLSFGSMSNLKNLTTITSIYNVSYAAVINGVVVAYSEFGHVGYCLAGNSEIAWQSRLPDGTTINGPFRVSRGEMIAAARINGLDGYAKSTNNGVTWSFNTVAYGNGDIELIGTKSWSLSATSWGYIESNDFANGTWTTDTFNENLEGNTTSINGQFKTTSDKMLMFPNDWRIYGYIEKDSNQTLYHYPAVNKSTDDGKTWVTSLLTGGFPKPDKIQGQVYATSTLTVLEYQENLMPQPEYYSSTDGIAFTKMSTDPDFLKCIHNVPETIYTIVNYNFFMLK